jgi:hypothetical protein
LTGLLLALALAVACERGSSAARLPAGGRELPEAEARGVVEMLLAADAAGVGAALDRVLESGDRRFVAPLVELVRGDEIGAVASSGHEARIRALEGLSGQGFGADWAAWVEWYGGTDLVPPPGFRTFKGELFARIDPGFQSFFREESPARIRVEEITWSGVLPDAIPALDDPKTLAAEEAEYLFAGEPVFGLVVGGEARAYPLRILDWHEVVNDAVGGVPVSLAYCTLSGTALAFDTRRPDAEPLRFATSGLLLRSNKLMLDRGTRTLWSQLTGTPVLGPLAAQEITLPVLPMVLTSWQSWRDRHPDTRVLSLETGHERTYAPGEPYAGYFASPTTLFPVGRRSEKLPTKARVYALLLDAVPKAYPVDALVKQGVVNDRVGDTDVVLVAQAGTLRVEGRSERSGAISYEAGAEVRAYRGDGSRFGAGAGPGRVRGPDGRDFEVTEEALVGPAGERLARVPGALGYWFAWYAFHPETLVYAK